MSVGFHHRFLVLVEDIERRFPVANWNAGDLDVWPLVRVSLYNDMYWQSLGRAVVAPRGSRCPALAPLAARLRDAWKSRSDLKHWVARPKRAHAILLGDGVCVDYTGDAWRDRYGEPLVAALEERGLDTFVMQRGVFHRRPWHRPTFAASVIEAQGRWRSSKRPVHVDLPAHDEVLEYLAAASVHAPSLHRHKLEERANLVAATATEFERVLRIVRPSLAFVVSYYSGAAPALVLACRRQGILTIDLQNCPQEGAHDAYRWWSLPPKGYTVLPAIFWNWTERDAEHIRQWTRKLEAPWHRSVWGGHTQRAAFLAENNSSACRGIRNPTEAEAGGTFDREILVALQSVHGYRTLWSMLAEQIESAPASWRWWIRRHPASPPDDQAEYACLLSIRKPNVVIDQASQTPLPALFQRVTHVVSLASGTTAEAAMFGLPAFFLRDEARARFADVIDRKLAMVIDVQKLNSTIAEAHNAPTRSVAVEQPNIHETLRELEAIARDYSQQCANHESPNRTTNSHSWRMRISS